MTDPVPLTLLPETTPEGVIGSLEAALQVAKDTPMAGCCVLLFDSEARCYQFREVSKRRRLETLGTLVLVMDTLTREMNDD